MRLFIALYLLVLLSSGAAAQTDRIRINQVGFYTDAPKRAVVVDASAGPFTVHEVTTGAVVASGTLGGAETWDLSGETVRLAAFDALQAVGTFEVQVPGVGRSAPFRIDSGVLAPVLRDAVRAFYYQRASTPLLPEHAGLWARAEGHPDTEVVVHASAATAARPTGSTIASPGGWYDAGDFGKYTSTAVMAVWPLLAMWEREPGVMGLELGIPESGDAVPDVLDEAIWELRWMLTMQDDDGGVYHKLTTANFVAAPMPADDDATRYVVVKTSQSTLASAAVFAQAARVLAPYAAQRPGLADSLEAAAVRAWAWGVDHRFIYYDQAAMNAAYDPDVTTGAYEDGWAGDEAKWAAAELFLLTEDPAYWAAYTSSGSGYQGLPAYYEPSLFGDLDLWLHRDRLPSEADRDAPLALTLSLADRALTYAIQAPYRTSIGAPIPSGGFRWGSNEVPGSTAMLLYHAWRATGAERYRQGVLAEMDYLLGRNAVGISFVTGHGTWSPQVPHHSMSDDGVAAPIPGFVVGGPNPGQQDGCPGYPSDLPARSYLDDYCSYASNEVAINWQGALVAGLAAAEALGYGFVESVGTTPEAEPVAGLTLDTIGPTPTRGRLTVQATLAEPAEVRVEVFDARGRRVHSRLGAWPAGPQQAEIDLTGAAPGVYLVRLSTASTAAIRTVSVIR